MARPLRIEYPGALYHITNRGNARQAIFSDTVDREAFLALLAEVIERFGWLCHAYCLMDNHYHLVVETPDPNLSVGMRHLNGVYTQRFNRRHQRIGYLFRGVSKPFWWNGTATFWSWHAMLCSIRFGPAWLRM